MDIKMGNFSIRFLDDMICRMMMLSEFIWNFASYVTNRKQ